MATTTAPEVTAEATEADRRVAPFVVVGQIGNPGRCQAWMDAADRQCSKPTDGLLCPRHRTVAAKRREAWRAKREQEQAKRVERVAHAKAHEQGNRAELDRVNAELDRLTAPVVADRAATGGAVHPSVAKRVNAQFSDSRVQKAGRLMGRQKELEAQIALAQS
ncbi:hypothetical protein M3B61_09975 [Micrococcus luteus]|nr:hypothetical protein [Micrococcus luteus]MCV7583878.1 hypothetical protein [Micrococcus luteus]MCV7588318.1 hypothetical protein [Micrococcus luteus]